MSNQSVHPAKHRQRSIWAGVLIVLLAAVLRLTAFDEALVGADQSSILASAAEIAAGRDLPLVGIKSSVGVMQTAVTPYLAALGLLLVRRVIAVKWLFSILDLLAVALLFNAVKRRFGTSAASIAALLYATNPWVVEFNRWIWYQTLIPTFASVTFSAYLLIINAPKRRSSQQTMLALGLLSATLMGLVHLAAAPWAMMLGALGLLLAWRNGWWRGLAVGLTLSLLVAAPYLFYLAKTHFGDVSLILGGDGGSSTWNWAAYRLSQELLTGAQVLQTPRDPLWAESVFKIPALYTIVPATLLLAAILALATVLRRRGPWIETLFTLLWTLLAPTLFLRTHIHLQHFYLLFLLPAPYVLIAAGMSSLQARAENWANRIYRVLQALSIGALLVLSLWWTYLWLVRIGYESQGQLRAATRAWLMDLTADRITDYLRASPENQVILLNTFEGGDISAFDWVRNFVHDDRVRITPTGQGLIIPATPTCYLLAPGATAEHLRPLAGLTENPLLTIPATPPWPAYCTSQRAPLQPSLATWQNGLSLLGSEVTGEMIPGGVLQLTHTWHYRVVENKEYHFFNHLLYAEETPVAQIDGAGVPTWYWRDDDVLITHFTLQLPATLEAGPYRLLAGAYTWPDIERVFLNNGDGAYEIQTWDIP